MNSKLWPSLSAVVGLKGDLRGHRPAPLLYLCWSHANIMCFYGRISNSILYAIILVMYFFGDSVDKPKITTDCQRKNVQICNVHVANVIMSACE